MIPVDWTSIFEPAPTRSSVYGSGHVTLFSNTRTVRIEWGDCDPAGIIFYPRYFEIFDVSTTTLFERALGLTKLEAQKAFDFAGFPVLRTRARFLRPTRYGDDISVESKIAFGRSSFEVDHRLSLKGETCAEGAEKRVWVVRAPDNTFRSSPVPDEVIKKFRLG